MNKLYIITGPAGVGKTTVSNRLAESLEKSVLIEGDTIYNQYVAGRVSSKYNGPEKELFWGICKYLIKTYLENGYDVVFNYIIYPDRYTELKEIFANYDIIFKILIANEKTLINRDHQRPVDCQMGKRSIELLHDFLEYYSDSSYIIDSSDLDTNETVNKIKE